MSIHLFLTLRVAGEGVQSSLQLLPHTECGSTQLMLRQRLSELLLKAAIKVAETEAPEKIKTKLKQERQAIIDEVNGYRIALSKAIAPN